MASDIERERALELLRRHGWNTTSFQTLESGFQYFFEDDAFVGYVDTGSAWVAAGAPVAAPEHLVDVANRFESAARSVQRRACFFAAGERFADATTWAQLRIGDQPIWDPTRWQQKVGDVPSLRAQIKRARNKNVVVRRAAAGELGRDAPLRRAVQNVANAWTDARDMAPMGFLVGVEPFTFANERRFYVAEQGERLVGFLSAVPIYARNGWLLEDLLRVHDAPNGTAELLIDAAMRDAASDGARLVTLGMAPLSGEIPRRLKWIRELARPLYDFGGVHAFKNKLRPDGWEPLFLLTPTRDARWPALVESLRAFARGSLASFALQTFVRGPPFVLAGLVALLALWIPVLAIAPSAEWFPAPWVQWSWVGFDVLLVVLLATLARHYTHWLGVLCASLVSLDAAVTLVEALSFNVPRLDSVVGVAGTVVACAGPLLAASALWGLVRTQKEIAVRTAQSA
ncbi:MAG: DUF2156 domain-containing protein [Sandaracinaceae bacterium]|nr:DUF2156 domain-containing protein [Sandaracinaceae bacterium]